MIREPNRGEMVEVRCCCNAGQLLGYLPYQGPLIELLYYPALSTKPVLGTDQVPIVVEEGHLEWGQWYGARPEIGDYQYAYKSNDYPLEVLEGLRGWKPA